MKESYKRRMQYYHWAQLINRRVLYEVRMKADARKNYFEASNCEINRKYRIGWSW